MRLWLKLQKNNFMKLIRLSLCLCLFLIGQKIYGQQIPVYSQYFHNQFIYNPAWAGNYEFASANLTYRSQWAGVDGGPQTALFTFDLPFYEYKCGIGMNITQDRIKTTNTTKAMFTYAYHIFGPYYNSSKLSFGISGGILMMNTDMTNYYLRHPEDPYINDRQGSYMAFEMGFGVNYIYRNKLQLGLSAPQLFNPGVNVADEGFGKFGLKNHFLFSAKGIIDLPDGVSRIEPMLMVRSSINVPIQFDLGAQYTYDDLLWGCFSYRTDYAYSLAVGVMLNAMRIGIARDFATGAAAGTLGSATEIMIGYKFRHLPKESYAGKRGIGSTIRHKVYHPSRSGPLPGQNMKRKFKKKSKKI